MLVEGYAFRLIGCEAVVYEILLSCGCFYTGQTGRCVNVRVGEHANKVKKKATDSPE